MPERTSPPPEDVIAFGNYTLHPSERRLEKAGVAVRLSGRALDILIALTARAGEIVGGKELIALVWPDGAVDDSSLRFHMTTLRKALGDARTITNVSGRGYCFVAPVSRSVETRTVTASPANSDRPYNLPARLMRMVGRDEAVRATTAQLLERRFVTIVGPGGIGKTTVAVAVADASLASFGNSVHFVDFTPVRDPSLVPSTVASALGLAVQSTNPIGNLVSFLRDRTALIVLDCCEHLVDAVATLAEQIFRQAPLVHILATSRESLRVEGEHIHRLLPLESPPNGVPITAAEAASYPAVQLFVERATAGLDAFQLRDADAPVVADICRRLDGIALAIEMAAGRVDAYGVEGIAGLLDDRFRLLTRGRRTALARHQTLRAALDWSYDLLPEPERTVLCRLSIFAGTFTLEAARSVAAGDDIGGLETIDAIENLVAKSLVAVDVRGTATRYRLLDTTRVYALRKLDENGGTASCARRHAIYCCQFLQQMEAQSVVGSTSGDRAQDIGNTRAALEWALSPDGDAAIGFALVSAVGPLLLELSLLDECRAWAEKAIALPDPDARDSHQEMLLQMSLGISILYTVGNSDEAHTALTRALRLAEELDDPYYELHTLEALSIFHQRTAERHTVLMLAVRGEALIKVLADRTGCMPTDWMMGSSQQFAGNQGRALEYAKNSVRNAAIGPRDRRFGLDRRNNALITSSRALWMLGFPEQALAAAHDVVAEARELNHAASLCVALHWMTSVSLWAGDLGMAEELIETLLERAETYSLAAFHDLAVGWNGALTLRRGRPEDAIRLFRTSLESLDAIRHRMMKTAFLAELAQALAAAGRREEGLAVIDEAIMRVEQTGEFMYSSEVLRIKGEILASDDVMAEEFLLRSLACAREQEALSWELRAATSLAGMRRRQGRSTEARAVLAPVYSRFGEGFDTADLMVAKRLLDEIA